MYVVIHKNGQDTVYVDWSLPGEEWVDLGRYEFIDHESQGVVLSDLADGYVVADAIKIESLSRVTGTDTDEFVDQHHIEVTP